MKKTPEINLDGATLLDRVATFLRRYVALSLAQKIVLALWVAHTHCFLAAECTPYLAITSAEKQSGKTRLLEVLEPVVDHPWLTGQVTAAVLARKISAELPPTLLLDESDAAFSGPEEYAETLRGVLNSGYRRGGTYSRCVGQGTAIKAQDFSTFCPKAIAGIGKLPDTVADRSIPIRLKRALRSEGVQRFRRREVVPEASSLRNALERWSDSLLDTLPEARPDLPQQLSDRKMDVAEPLLAIADAAGGDWPAKARQALVELCADIRSDESIGTLLLRDIRQIFEARGVERISSDDLTADLCAIETSPWGEWNRGKPITKAKLARLLGPFGVVPDSKRFGDTGKVLSGYETTDFDESWGRYLPLDNTPFPSSIPFSKYNNSTARINIEENDDFESATDPPCSTLKNSEIANTDAACRVVELSKAQVRGGGTGNQGEKLLYTPDSEGVGCTCKVCDEHFEDISEWSPHFSRSHRSVN
jgi:hypothetical protein